MRKHLGMILLAVVTLLGLLFYTIAYVVEEGQDIVLVKTFGAPTKDLDGRKPVQAGLYFKWPWPIQEVVRYDGRLIIVEDDMEQLNTRDSRDLIATLYCGWKIADARKFQAKRKTVENAMAAVKEKLKSSKSQIMREYDMVDIVNTDPSKMRIPEIEKRIRENMNEVLSQDGIEVAVVGVKNLGLSDLASKQVIQAMQAERKKMKDTIEAEGDAQAQAIREWAKAASDKILAFARRKAADIRGEGDRAAAETYKKYHEHPEFAIFLRELEMLRSSLKSKTVLLLDGMDIRALKFLRDGPSTPPPPKTEPTKK
ncbi:MAG: hypothetical protein HZA50_00795 [Planctomycetes bacterium]|nr:hypothetical protein [Planctomycetota bacterium]